MNLLETRIDLGAIAANTRIVKNLIGDTQLMCVVKADAYNHGVERVAPVMADNGADQFGVATIAEALQLRAVLASTGHEQPILCWIWGVDQDLHEALDNDIELAVASVAHAKAVVAALEQRAEHRTTPVTVKIDTGLHRSGVDESQWREVFEILSASDAATVSAIFSHLACADDLESPYTDEQAVAFNRGLDVAREYFPDVIGHLANSPATLTRKDLRHDMVRPGVCLYGLEPIPGMNHGLQPAMSFVGEVTVVKPVKAGEGTSYGLTWKADKDGFVAVVPAGYADGVPRAAQDHIEVTIDGKRYPQVGRVCMDQIVIDLGDNADGVAQGDEAIIFGAGGMSATELAESMGTINYEIVCRPCGRTVRTYVEGTGQ